MNRPVPEITSFQNPKIKEIVSLCDKAKVRREKSLFTIEGVRELKLAQAAGYRIESIFYVPELLEKHQELDERTLLEMEYGSIYRISAPIYGKLAYRDTTEGIIAVAETRKIRLGDIRLPENPLVIVLENIEKPGNIGAVLRSADACGADAVLFCDCSTEIHNPNLIRSSLGTFFTVKSAECTSKEAITWLKKQGIRIYTAQLQDSEWYYRCDMKGPTAIVMGSEDKGLSTLWRKASDAKIKIPMLGKADSLNVSVSTAILCYEAVRQRLDNGNGNTGTAMPTQP